MKKILLGLGIVVLVSGLGLADIEVGVSQPTATEPQATVVPTQPTATEQQPVQTEPAAVPTATETQPTPGTAQPAVVQAPSETAAPKKEETRLGCSMCNVEFKTAKEAHRHFKKAHGKKHYCEKCNLAWGSKKEKMDHAKATHPKYECCGQKFANDKEHDQHMKEHHGGAH